MKTSDLARDPARCAATGADRAATQGTVPDNWTAFWRGFRTFILGRDQIDYQYAGWRQQYARYFGVRPLHKARS